MNSESSYTCRKKMPLRINFWTRELPYLHWMGTP